MPSPASPDPWFPWEDDEQQPGISIRPLSHAELGALIAELKAADPDQPAQAVLDHWMPTPAPAPPAELPVRATVGRPGGSAEGEYRRRHAVERAAWVRTLLWRLAGVLAAGTGAGLLAAQVIPHLAGVAGLLVAAGLGWRLRFRVSPDTSAWRRGAAGERHTARLLHRLERHGWVVLHDLAIPGSAANTDHLAIGPGGVVVIDSKQYRGQLQLDPHGFLWHGRYPLMSALRAARWEADRADEVLGVADVGVAAIVAVRGAGAMYLALSRGSCSGEAAVSNQPVTRGYVVGRGEGVPGRGPDVKASGRSTGGSLTVIEATIDGGPPRHTHSREDESFYVLTGTLDGECGEDRFRAGSGSFVFLPRNLPHVFRSVGGPATALLIVTPGGLDEYFAELSAALAANADAAQVRTIQQAYGIARS